MMTDSKSPLAVVALVVALASGCGQEEAAREAQAPKRFVADLKPLNDSGVEGRAQMSLSDDHLTVDIDGRDLERGIHGQYIHGAGDAERKARCPAPAADADSDGFVGLEEAERDLGRAELALEPFPTVGKSGRLDWDLTVNVDARELAPLDRRVLVLRGRSADIEQGGGKEFAPDLPVACGTIEPAAEVASEGGAG